MKKIDKQQADWGMKKIISNIRQAPSEDVQGTLHAAIEQYKATLGECEEARNHVYFYHWMQVGEGLGWYDYCAADERFSWDSSIRSIYVFEPDTLERSLFPDLEGIDKVYIAYDEEGALFDLDEETAKDMIADFRDFWDHDGRKGGE